MSANKQLWPLFGAEALNLFAHRGLHYATNGAAWPDIVSSVLSLLIVFGIGWILGRTRARYGYVMLTTAAFWLFSTIVAVVLTSLVARMEADALKGYILAMVMFLPIGLVIAAIAAATSRRRVT